MAGTSLHHRRKWQDRLSRRQRPIQILPLRSSRLARSTLRRSKASRSKTRRTKSSGSKARRKEKLMIVSAEQNAVASAARNLSSIIRAWQPARALDESSPQAQFPALPALNKIYQHPDSSTSRFSRKANEFPGYRFSSPCSIRNALANRSAKDNSLRCESLPFASDRRQQSSIARQLPFGCSLCLVVQNSPNVFPRFRCSAKSSASPPSLQ